LPSGVFKPYAGVSTAILLFTKTESGGTDFVWFYDVKADGLSLDDKRSPLLPDDKQGAVPVTPLTDEEHSKNNLPDVLRRWRSLPMASTLMAERSRSHQSQSLRQSSSLSEVEGTVNEAGDPSGFLASTPLRQVQGIALSQRSSEYDRPRTAQSFCVPKADIVAQGYDLSLNRYKEVVHEEVDHRDPKDIIADLARLEAEIQQGIKELEGLLASTLLNPKI